MELDEIVVHKADRQLVLTPREGARMIYAVDLGRNWAADKAVEGDQATPLGEFYVCAKNPRSKYCLSLCLSYPNAEDAERGLQSRLINGEEYERIITALRSAKVPPQHTRLGGEIYIHGRGPSAPRAKDWTHGCIAVSDPDMREVYAWASLGTRVRILE